MTNCRPPSIPCQNFQAPKAMNPNHAAEMTDRELEDCIIGYIEGGAPKPSRILVVDEQPIANTLEPRPAKQRQRPQQNHERSVKSHSRPPQHQRPRQNPRPHPDSHRLTGPPETRSPQGNSVDSHLRPPQHQRPHPDLHRFAGPPETRSRRPDHHTEDLTDSHDEIRTLRRQNRELTNENVELRDLNLNSQREIASLRKLLQNLPASRTEGSAQRPEDPVRQDNWRQPVRQNNWRQPIATVPAGGPEESKRPPVAPKPIIRKKDITQSSTPSQKLPLDNDNTDDFIASFEV
jgi:hypothetical protein